MLDVDSVIPFLVERELLDQEQILMGAVAVETVPRRNCNLRVTTSPTSGVFIKQPEELAPASDRTLRAEADFYGRHAFTGSPVAGLLPRLLLWEPAVPLLVLELLPTHRTLAELHGSPLEPRFPVAEWRALGHRLGALHRTLVGRDVGAAALGVLPWVMGIHRPSPSALSNLSPANLQILEIVQGSAAISEGLDGLPGRWASGTVIHGDLRADNVLVRWSDGAIDDLRVVDWEFHQIGDPAWDIAVCLEALVGHWLSCLHSAQEDGSAELVALSRFPPAMFQGAARAFWEGYAASVSNDAWVATAGPNVAGFCAARLLQSAIEATAQSTTLPASVILRLQVCENILADPARASTELLALT
jgi:hypothetical protein